MNPNLVREWIDASGKAVVSIGKYYSDPSSHWIQIASEKPKDALVRLIEVIFLSTVIQLLFLSATYKEIATTFGLNVARIVIFQIALCLFYFPGMLLSFTVIKPETRPNFWHIADYVVMQSQVTAILPSLAFALFYSSESYAFYVVGTILTLLAGLFFIVRVAFVPSRIARLWRRIASSAALLACQIVLGGIVAVAFVVASPRSEGSSGNIFADPVAGEVLTASLAIDKEMKDIGTVSYVNKALSGFNEVISKVILRSESGNVALDTIDVLRSLGNNLDSVMKADRSILARVEKELQNINGSSKFRTTQRIVRQTQEGITSYFGFLDSTELYFRNNKELIDLLAAISATDVSGQGSKESTTIVPKNMTADQLSKKIAQLQSTIDKLAHEIKRINELVKDGIELTETGISAVKDLQRALDSQIEFQTLVSNVRRLSPLYSVAF